MGYILHLTCQNCECGFEKEVKKPQSASRLKYCPDCAVIVAKTQSTASETKKRAAKDAEIRAFYGGDRGLENRKTDGLFDYQFFGEPKSANKGKIGIACGARGGGGTKYLHPTCMCCKVDRPRGGLAPAFSTKPLSKPIDSAIIEVVILLCWDCYESWETLPRARRKEIEAYATFQIASAPEKAATQSSFELELGELVSTGTGD